jgi:NADH-quinone oxidoreductase subunit J
VIAALLPTGTTPLLVAAIAAGTASLWLLLPQASGAGGRTGSLGGFFGGRTGLVGIVLGLAALAGLALAGRRLGGLGEEAAFQLVALVAIVGGAATVVTRSPVYSAIWFALALAGVAGVLLVLGAQFLGVATIVVYAGAILVMFLFVLMLAQPTGMAPYDRVSNEPLLAAIAGGVLLALLTTSIGRLSADPPACCTIPSRADAMNAAPSAPRADKTVPGVAAAPVAAAVVGAADPDALSADPVARLGRELFGRHLLAVEAAGLLLLVALIGAIAVVSRGEEAGTAERGTR